MPLFQIRNEIQNAEKTILFTHIPKTGGVTIEKALEGLGLKPFLTPEHYAFVRKYLNIPPAHFHYEIIEKIYNLNNLYCFTITRNPVDRIISHYQWARTYSKLDQKIKNLNLKNYLEFSFNEYYKDNNFFSNHIRPQTDFVGKKTNKIFKYEDGLEKNLTKMLADNNIKINGNINLPMLNKSKGKKPFIDEESKNLIKNFYKKDFIKFNYKIK